MKSQTREIIHVCKLAERTYGYSGKRACLNGAIETLNNLPPSRDINFKRSVQEIKEELNEEKSAG